MPLTDNQKGHLRHVRLNVWEVKMIQFVAASSGEVSFDWRNVAIGVRRAMVQLADKHLIEVYYSSENIRLVTVETLVQRPALTRIRLSDQGRSVMESLGQMTVGQ